MASNPQEEFNRVKRELETLKSNLKLATRDYDSLMRKKKDHERKGQELESDLDRVTTKKEGFENSIRDHESHLEQLQRDIEKFLADTKR